MTNEIKPALTAEEWTAIQSRTAGFPGLGVALENPARAIAVCNDRLSNSDKRKITREWVSELRRLAAGDATLDTGSVDFGELTSRMADALESYLPPV